MKREEIKEKDKWDLSKMFKSLDEFNESYEDVKKLIGEVVAFKGHIMDSGDSLYNFYKTYEKMDRLSDKVIIYSRLLCDSDTTNSDYQALKAKTDKLLELESKELAFINPEMLDMDYDNLLEMIKGDDRFDEYRHELDDMFRYKAHILSDAEENVIAASNGALGVGSEVFYNLNNADIDLGEIKDEEGKIVKLTPGNYNSYLVSKNREVRKEAFNHMYEYFKKHKNTLAACYKGTIKEDFFISNLRKYDSPLVMSLFKDKIDVDVYKNLIEFIHNNLDVLHDYIALRKKALKLDDMHMYDLFVDIADKKIETIPFDDGKKMIMEALKPLGENYIRDLNKAFDERWIDIYPNDGKNTGGYTWGCYDSCPYILYNYTDDLQSISGVAHELGHAMHSYYSKNQTFINHSYPIFLAEIASKVNEILLKFYLCENAKTKEEKINYLASFIEESRTYIYRPVQFAEFEMMIHDKEKNNIPLTCEEFYNAYYDLNKLYYGDNIISDEEIGYEWSRIPHFYTPFYTYKYATGTIIAIAIASDLLKDNEDMKDKYLEFLSSGGKDYPLDILKNIGIDLNDNTIYEKSIAMFREKLKELEELL